MPFRGTYLSSVALVPFPEYPVLDATAGLFNATLACPARAVSPNIGAIRIRRIVLTVFAVQVRPIPRVVAVPMLVATVRGIGPHHGAPGVAAVAAAVALEHLILNQAPAAAVALAHLILNQAPVANWPTVIPSPSVAKPI